MLNSIIYTFLKMNQNTETISFLNFENGMYIIRISNGNNQTIQRIIKE